MFKLATRFGTAAASVVILGSLASAQLVTQVLVSSEGIPYDRFGYSVATDQLGNPDGPVDRLLVGAYGAQRAYLFERVGGAFVEQAVLVPSTPPSTTFLGTSLLLSGDFAALGSGSDFPSIYVDTSVHVFANQGGLWGQVAELTSPASSDAGFGRNMLLAGDRLLISAPNDSTVQDSGGAVYVYADQGGWGLESEIRLPATSTHTRFGYDMAFHGTTLVVSSIATNASDVPAGAIHLFERVGNDWVPGPTLTTPLTNSPNLWDGFGAAVDLFGDRMVVWESSKGSGINPAAYAGEPGLVHVLERDTSGWQFTDALLPVFGSLVGDVEWGRYELSVRGSRVAFHQDIQWSASSQYGALICYGVESGSHEFEDLVTFYSVISEETKPHLLTENLAAVAYAQNIPGANYSPWQLTLLDLSTFPDALSTEVSGLSVTDGGYASLGGHLGPDAAGDLVLILGSVTGTSPVVPLAPGIDLPLVVDAYTLALVTSPGAGVMTFGLKAANPQGGYANGFHLPTNLPSSLVGLDIHHAAVHFDGTTAQLAGATNAVSFQLLP